MMKVLYLTHLYPPEHIGGTEHYTHALAKALIARGHQAQVLCVAGWERGERYWNGQSDDLFEGVPVRRLHLNWTQATDVNRYLYDNPVAGNYVRTYLREARPDLVHVTSCQTLSVNVIGSAKDAGLPVVVTLTDFWFLCPRVTLVRGDGALCDGRVKEKECLRCLFSRAKAYRWPRIALPEHVIVRLLSAVSRHAALSRLPGLRGMAMDISDRRVKVQHALRQADRVLIASRFARELFRVNGFSLAMHVVPYGHDLSWLTQYAGKTPRDVLSVGFIGQMTPSKGLPLLIEAYRRASTSGHTRLLVYGNMQKDPTFSQQVRALANGRTDIEFRGTYPYAESGQVFAEIDVLVVPSLWYDFPLIINQAFAARTPVIATDLGGIRELVQPEVSGLLFERGSVGELAQQLRRVFADEGLLARLGAGIPRVRRAEEAADEMIELYRNVASER